MQRRRIERMLARYRLTDFQVRVLIATCRIPRGRTATYKEVARMAGSANAYRAVGTALRKNPLPITIPCHRVIRSDGELGNYSSGGARRKLELLEREGWRGAASKRAVCL